MRLLFLSDYQAFFQALEEEAQRYASLELACCDSTTQPLALPDFDFLLLAPLGKGGEIGMPVDLDQLEFWEQKLPQLVDLCRSREARIALWTSDLVFNSEQQAISELDTPENTSRAAELLLSLEALVASQEQNLVLRTPPSLSADPEGGLAQLIKQCKAHKAPENIDYRGLQPLNDVARVLLGILLQVDAGASATGIYHYAGSEPVSQTELMHTLARYLKTPPYPADPSGTSRQGVNSRHLLENFGVHPRAWRASLPSLLEQMNEIKPTQE